ncbi:hypothetical protein [Streptomyces sp. NPDC091371]|uniref:hypothetical protein n=1 Tax=Streptomyces sp. NPDC091371 TaxID=3155303 RepID=UPI00342FAE13
MQFAFRVSDPRVIAVGDAWPGNRNDIVVFRATMTQQIAGHRLTIRDGAYRSAPESSPAGTRASRSPGGGHGPNTASPASRTTAPCASAGAEGPRSTTPPRAVAVLDNLKIDNASLRIRS